MKWKLRNKVLWYQTLAYIFIFYSGMCLGAFVISEYYMFIILVFFSFALFAVYHYLYRIELRRIFYG